MKRIAAVILAMIALGSFAQQIGKGAIDWKGRSLTLELADPPQPVPSATVQRKSGNPGLRTLYYWIVTQTAAGASTPAGPFALHHAPDGLSSTASTLISWAPVSNAVSYDVLRTSSPVAPERDCNCAVSTGVTGTSTTDESELLLAYTVTALDPTNASVVLTNEADGITARRNGQPVAIGGYAKPFGTPFTAIDGYPDATNWPAGYGNNVTDSVSAQLMRFGAGRTLDLTGKTLYDSEALFGVRYNIGGAPSWYNDATSSKALHFGDFEARLLSSSAGWKWLKSPQFIQQNFSANNPNLIIVGPESDSNQAGNGPIAGAWGFYSSVGVHWPSSLASRPTGGITGTSASFVAEAQNDGATTSVGPMVGLEGKPIVNGSGANTWNGYFLARMGPSVQVLNTSAVQNDNWAALANSYPTGNLPTFASGKDWYLFIAEYPYSGTKTVNRGNGWFTGGDYNTGHLQFGTGAPYDHLWRSLTDNNFYVKHGDPTSSTDGLRLLTSGATTANPAKLTSNPWGLRAGELQNGAQFVGMGVSKSAADNNYIAATNNTAGVNHMLIEFATAGSIKFRYQAHQSDNTVLSSLFDAVLFGTDGSITAQGKASFASGGSANKAVCWKADGKTLGYCSTQPDASGSCTCN